MFEGSVSEQLHQFLTPRTTTPPPNSNSLPLIPLNFALHSPNFNFHPFDSYNATSTTHHHHHQIHLHHPHHLLHHQSPNPHENGDEKDDDETTTTTGNNLQVAMDLEVGRENNNNNRSILMEDHIHHGEWSNDELLALLRIRSNIDNCFLESTWEHVSRKLGEVGFRRTAEKCKEKFEEESRYFNHINYNKTCRFLTHELNYHHHHQDDQDHLLLIHDGNGKPDDGGATVVVVPEEGEEENEANFKDRGGLQEEEEEEDLRKEEMRAATNEDQDESSRSRSCKKKKRKMMRQKEFELLKGYCEEIVKKMMIQQEEIHSKLLEDMLKREEEKVAKEECWKRQQMEKLHKELEVMAHEQAIASDRQATIIEILNQITNSTTLFSSSQSQKELQNLLQSLNNYNNNNVPNSPSSSSLIQTQTSSPNKEQQQQQVALPPHENSSSFTSQNDPIKNPKNPCLSTQILAPQDPNSFINHSKLPSNPKSRDHKDELDELGKRWPRDEVLALVNVRCNLYNNGDGSGEQGASLKAPLWERISQGMLQLGYKRSAKRCKEKWENINKYFRKTKDANKKRSLDSRTCPYFHQLSTLYNQGGAANKHPENCPIVSPENHSDQFENHLTTSS